MNRLILMLEQDADDRYITQTFFDEQKDLIKVEFVTSHNDLTNFLAQSPLPSLILLDYNTYPLDAIGILKDLKNNPSVRHIPVIIVSGIKDKQIIRQCYEHGASSFIEKPFLHEETKNKISDFINYWFNIVELDS